MQGESGEAGDRQRDRQRERLPSWIQREGNRQGANAWRGISELQPDQHLLAATIAATSKSIKCSSFRGFMCRADGHCVNKYTIKKPRAVQHGEGR